MIYGDSLGSLLVFWGNSLRPTFAQKQQQPAGVRLGLHVGQQTPANKAHRPDHKATPWTENQPSVWSDGTGYSCRAADERH